jgi:hypothetical protein
MDTSDMQTSDFEAVAPCAAKKTYEQPTGPLSLSMSETEFSLGFAFDGITSSVS